MFLCDINESLRDEWVENLKKKLMSTENTQTYELI